MRSHFYFLEVLGRLIHSDAPLSTPEDPCQVVRRSKCALWPILVLSRLQLGRGAHPQPDLVEADGRMLHLLPHLSFRPQHEAHFPTWPLHLPLLPIIVECRHPHERLPILGSVLLL